MVDKPIVDKAEQEKQTTMTSPHKSNTNNAKSSGAASFKLLLLVLMVLQNSSTVLVGRHTRSSVAKEELYVVNHLILVTEGMKVRSL